jgi:proteic killer suppression protein
MQYLDFIITLCVNINMLVSYKNDSIKQICQDFEHACKKFGEKIATRLFQRIGEIRAVENIMELKTFPAIECEAVEKANSVLYTVNLSDTQKLLFLPLKEDPLKNESLITEVELHEVLN